jgi:hypothetical protein
MRRAFLGMTAAALLGRLVQPAAADEDEARWSLHPAAGLIRATEPQAEAAFALAQGVSMSMAYGLTETLDLSVEAVAVAAEPTFDAAIPVQNVIVRTSLKRRISSAWVLVGPTWRLGSPAGWTPTLSAFVGGGARYRSIALSAEYDWMPDGKTASGMLDLAAGGRAGIERRVHRRWTVGAYGSLMAAWGPDAPLLPMTTLSLGVSYSYYPRWRGH